MARETDQKTNSDKASWFLIEFKKDRYMREGEGHERLCRRRCSGVNTLGVKNSASSTTGVVLMGKWG